MVGAFLGEARPCEIDGSRVIVRFSPGAGFSKKKVESNRALVQDAVRAIAGAPVSVVCEIAESDEEEEVPVVATAAATAVLSEEELVERLKGEFGAREVFDDPEES
jgi:hypothetical protein